METEETIEELRTALAELESGEGLSQFANHLPQPQQCVLHRVFGIVVTQIPARRQHQPGPQSLGFLLEFLLRHHDLFTLIT